MKRPWLIPILLTACLVVTALATVDSRSRLLESHRGLKAEERQLARLLEKERALKVELASRSDLNTLERRAVEELGMRPPRPDQWVEVKP